MYRLSPSALLPSALLILALSSTPARSTRDGEEKLSACLKDCLAPMVRMERTISYMFRNYERVCDLLEKSAKCAQRCGVEDQQRHFQYTTFYRVHCVDAEEGE